MSDDPEMKPAAGATEFASRSARRRRASSRRRRVTQTVWFGLGMMGLIGWSVAVPTLLGAALGLWLDEHYPGGHSWTLVWLAIGLGLGCFNAWHWVAKEDRAMHEQDKNSHE